MIWPAFIISQVKFSGSLVPLLIIILIGLFLRLYNIGQAFPFDYDQQVGAEASYNFFVNHRITLVGQELSFLGFFLGPLHNWIQFIPYGLCNLLPDCVPYFYIGIGLLTAILLYLVLKLILDKKTAIIATGIYAISFATISFERGVNSNYFLFLTSIGILFYLYKFFLGKNHYFIFGAFFTGLAVVNFNPVFIFSTIAFFLTSLTRKNKNLAIFFFGILAFFVNYTPLLIFNFRHSNILGDSFSKFIAASSATTDYFERFVFLVRHVVTPFLSNYLFQSADKFFMLTTVILIAVGLYQVFKIKDKFLLFLPIWIMVTVFGFVFYKGHIPDYYFQQILLPFVVLVALSLRKNLIIFIAFCAIFLFTNLIRIADFQSGINYKTKKEVINFVINDAKEASFNVYYDMPPGLNTGYGYLFKALGHEPQEGGKNLYILKFSDPTRFPGYKYHITFPNKSISLKTIGFVHIVSVK